MQGSISFHCVFYCHFFGGSGLPDVPIIKGEPKNIIYDEKPDYIPVYVSVADSMEHISAYVDNSAELSEGNSDQENASHEIGSTS